MARRKNDSSSERYREDLMEREFEARIEAKRQRPRGSSDQRRDREKPKAPLLLRILAWCGVILLCFVVGYLGTSYVLKLLDRQIFFKPGGLVENENDLQVFLSADKAVDVADVKLDMQKVALTLFYPKDELLVQERLELISRTFEDNIQEAIVKLLDLSGLFGKEVYVKHVFRNVDTVYLDFSGAFVPALAAAGVEPSRLFITGVVRTMQNNFSPITKVRFMVDSKITSAGSPVDLTATWQLPK